MRIAIGSDHAAVRGKDRLRDGLRALGHQVEDLGTDGEGPVDYPVYAERVGRAVAEGRAELGIALCGTGIGASIAANKVRGVRAALCHDPHTAEMSRRHNDANVLCMGGRLHDPEALEAIARVWLATPFEGGRHQRRLDLIRHLEEGDSAQA
ncbi:MAG: ribose 5-phosphate isomerase B [Planctomycetes bacterium]|nr:ribose 5-phosphate isomerase B [Planctomycetota bacterium]